MPTDCVFDDVPRASRLGTDPSGSTTARHGSRQTVFYAHLHVIPRHGGAVPDPAGGIRHTIPGRGRYPLDR